MSPRTGANCWQALAAHSLACIVDMQLGISERNTFYCRIELSAWAGLGRDAEGGRPKGGALARPRETKSSLAPGREAPGFLT